MRDHFHPEGEFLKFLSDIFCTAQQLNQAWMTLKTVSNLTHLRRLTRAIKQALTKSTPPDALRLGIHIPEVGRFFRFAFHRGDSSLGDRLSEPMA
jgi:hypothetical protein